MHSGYTSHHTFLADPADAAHVNRAALCCALFEPDDFINSYTISSSSRLPASRKYWTQVAPAIALSREFYALILQARDRATSMPNVGRLLQAPREAGTANISMKATCPISDLPLECRLDYWAPEQNSAIHVVLCDKPKPIDQQFIDKRRLPLIEAFTQLVCSTALGRPLDHFYFLVVNAQGPSSVSTLELKESVRSQGQAELRSALAQLRKDESTCNSVNGVGEPVVHLSGWGQRTYNTSGRSPCLVYDQPTQRCYFRVAPPNGRSASPAELARLAKATCNRRYRIGHRAFSSFDSTSPDIS